MANAMLNKGVVLNQLNRSDEALELYDDMIDRFDRSEQSRSRLYEGY